MLIQDFAAIWFPLDNFASSLTTQTDKTHTELETMQNMKRKNSQNTLSFKYNSTVFVKERLLHSVNRSEAILVEIKKSTLMD